MIYIVFCYTPVVKTDAKDLCGKMLLVANLTNANKKQMAMGLCMMSKTCPCGNLPLHSLLNRLSHSNTLLFTKSAANNLYANRHTLDQVDII